MKHYTKLFFAAAVAALGLASCAKEVAPVETPKDNLVTVHFGATAGIEGATKATLTPNEQETLFTSAWENGDVLSVKYSFDYGTPKETTATWSSDKSCFEAQIGGGNGIWIYDALYPTPKEVSFGSERTQNGNNYNSNYDLMKGSATAEGADAGKTADGKDIVFEMTRQTAIAYFHLTSDLDEEVVSAKLSVEGDGAYLSTSEVKANEEYAQGYAFTETEGVASKEINLTFTGEAPRSSNFKLWFNVLPTKYTKMTLTVETANNTLSISRTAEGKYEAGKLYKVSKSIPREKWVKKGGETPDTKDFVLVTSAQSDWSGSYLLVGVNDVDYYAFDESINTDSEYKWGKCSKVVVDNKTIASTYGTMALEIVPGTTENTYSILTPSGKYLSASAAKKFNLSGTYSADNCDFAISFGDNNEVVIKQASSLKLEETKHRQIRYNYIEGSGGLRWYDGASVKPVYLYKGPSVTKYSVSFSTVEGGKIAASLSRAEAGAEVTLTATPAEGYAFNEWSVKGADGTVIEVVDNKFTMPAQNVTVSGTFSKVAYTITKVTAENGSFIVKNGDAEVTTAFKGDKLTLEATPVEGFTFSNWNVTYKDGETEQTVNVNANAFYMPAANVTVSATFVEAAQVPVYASVADLITAGTPTKDGTKVTVTLMDEEIIRFHTLKDGTVAGAIIKVGTQEVEIFCKGTPSDWKVGGTISGTLTNCDWKLYYSTWELCPADYSELTYKAPLPTCATPVITIAEGGVVSIACETVGATIHYTVGDSPADPTETDAVFSAATLTDGQTIKAIAFAEGYKPSAVASKKYTAGGAVESKTYTLQFGKEYNSEGKSSYNNTWSATCDGFTWDMTNWNNNNNGWSYVKAGPKGNRNANAKIETAAAMPEAISKISITIDEVKNGSITSIVLKSSSTSDFISGTTIETKSAVSAGTVEFTIPSAQNNLYYQLDFTLNNTTPNSNKGKNGVVTVSKVVYTNN